MAEIKYLDFDLLIEDLGGKYRARVINSPTGMALTDFQIPFNSLEIENFLLRLGRTPASRGTASPEAKAARDFGQRLFNAVFTNEIKDRYRESRDEAARRSNMDQRFGLRLRMHLENAPHLADLPWEYLYDPSENLFVALSDQTPLVRYLDLAGSSAPLSVKPPIRVLVMISSPSNYPPLDVEKEWERLRNAVGDLVRRGVLTMERLNDASLLGLQRELRRGVAQNAPYHILHFIGHGGFDEQEQIGQLILEGPLQRGLPVSGQDLGQLLHDHPSLRLVVLNSCEGGRTSSQDPFGGVAQNLLQKGVPAVVAMQFQISDDAAITFSDELYRAIADNYPLDAALSQARQAIYNQGNPLEWGIPVLFLRTSDARIFAIQADATPNPREAQLTSLREAAQKAMSVQDWLTAIQKWKELLALDPNNADALTGLTAASEQQELASLYKDGCKQYELGHWREALDIFAKVQAIKPDYRDLSTVMITAQRELARTDEAERKRNQVEVLYEQAQDLIKRGDWKHAREKLRDILLIQPSHEQAAAELIQVERQERVQQLYESGRQSFDARHWREALDCFSQINDLVGSYKDVDRLIQVSQREEERERQKGLGHSTSIFGSLKLLSIGGCLGVLAIAACTIFILLPGLTNKPFPAVGAVEHTPPVANSVNVAPPSVATAASPTQDFALLYGDEIRRTINRAGNAQIDAVNTLSYQPLTSFYAGQALLDMEKGVETAKGYRARQIQLQIVITGRQINSLQVDPDGQHAHVQMVETWTAIITTLTDYRCFKVPQREPQEVHLQLVNSDWVIYSIDMEPVPEVTPIPC